MPSPRMDQVFYSAHSKASHYILRHTSHRFRAIIEHAVLGLAICAFCTVILSHRAFVHREDIACISVDYFEEEANNGCCRNNMSVYSILVQIVRGGYAWAVQGKKSTSSSSSSSSWPSKEKQIPLFCLKSIPGFREDADVNHILYQNNGGGDQSSSSSISLLGSNGGGGSRAFTIYRGHGNERLVTGYSFDQSKLQETCVIDNSETIILQKPQQQQQRRQHTLLERLWFTSGEQQIQQQYNPCSEQMMTFLSQHGYLPINETTNHLQSSPSLLSNNDVNIITTTSAATTLSPIIYSFSHSHGLLSLTPNLQHAHNVSTQFIIPSTTDESCFGEPFLKSIIFRLVGPDTVILNWILGLQHHLDYDDDGTERLRFVYHWKAKKLIDLDIFDKDHYAFSSRSGGDDEGAAAAATTTTTTEAYTSFWASKSIHALVSKVQKHPIYRLLRFLTFRLSVLLSSLFIFFLTTSLVSFTLQETQDRMLEFTLQLKDRVRNRLPFAGLIARHVLENLVFVPIMVGMIFFLIEYASLASTVLFLFHTILFFWNRYELPALHAGLITSQSPRASTGPIERGGWINIHNNSIGGGTETTVPSTFITQPYPVNELGSPMRSAVAAASTSLQSIRSLASIHSLTSLSLAERTPNLLFHGGHNLNDSIDTDGEDDSYIARVGGSASNDFNSFHHHHG
eukprot:scaffold13825_cov83-Skeletonema_menzelii.AAC.12